jgi:hypothetical protein
MAVPGGLPVSVGWSLDFLFQFVAFVFIRPPVKQDNPGSCRSTMSRAHHDVSHIPERLYSHDVISVSLSASIGLHTLASSSVHFRPA